MKNPLRGIDTAIHRVRILTFQNDGRRENRAEKASVRADPVVTDRRVTRFGFFDLDDSVLEDSQVHVDEPAVH